MTATSAAVQDSRDEAPPAVAARLGRARWIVLTLLLSVTVINFIDRQTVSVLAPVLRQMLHLSNEQYVRIVSAFQLGMTVGEFPMGWLMDRWGVRFGLAAAVLWWSVATAAQSITRSGAQLGLTRLWMTASTCGPVCRTRSFQECSPFEPSSTETFQTPAMCGALGAAAASLPFSLAVMGTLCAGLPKVPINTPSWTVASSAFA
jgi:MFS family permease